MRTLRYSTLQQALAFYRAGGIVIALGALPEASDRAGSSDPVLDEAVRELFGRTAAEARAVEGVSVQRGAAGGLAVTAASVEEAIDALGESFPRDFKYDVSCREQAGAAEDADGAYMADGADKNDYPYVQHRRIGKRDIYAVYRAPRGAVCFFRSRGAVSLWNPWDGTSAPLAAERVTAEGAYIRLPLDRRQLQLIVFSEAAEATELFEIAEGAEVADTLNAAGDADVEGTALTRSLAQDGEWSFELRPTMDNRFGDFRLPGEETLIGAEARYFKFAWRQTIPHSGMRLGWTMQNGRTRVPASGRASGSSVRSRPAPSLKRRSAIGRRWRHRPKRELRVGASLAGRRTRTRRDSDLRTIRGIRAITA